MKFKKAAIILMVLVFSLVVGCGKEQSISLSGKISKSHTSIRDKIPVIFTAHVINNSNKKIKNLSFNVGDFLQNVVVTDTTPKGTLAGIGDIQFGPLDAKQTGTYVITFFPKNVGNLNININMSALNFSGGRKVLVDPNVGKLQMSLVVTP